MLANLGPVFAPDFLSLWMYFKNAVFGQSFQNFIFETRCLIKILVSVGTLQKLQHVQYIHE